MSWQSSLFACIVPATVATECGSARDIISAATDIDDRVFAPSRNGVLVYNLGKICEASPRWQGLYLLTEEAVLAGESLRQQHELVGALLAEIARNPDFVVEAMKLKHEPEGYLITEGFEPRPYEMVYAADAVIKDGWVYEYSAEKVLAKLESAPCGPDPCPPGDDDGESLEFVFALLKSHHALLGQALERGAAVAAAEMST